MGNEGKNSIIDANITLYFPNEFKVEQGIYLLKNLNDDPFVEKNRIDTGSFLEQVSLDRRYQNVEFPNHSKMRLTGLHYLSNDLRAYTTFFISPDSIGTFTIKAVIRAENVPMIAKEFEVKVCNQILIDNIEQSQETDQSLHWLTQSARHQ